MEGIFRMHNAVGDNYRLTIFGASHAEKIGVRIEGLPAGSRIDLNKLQSFMDRRAPGKDRFSTARREPDRVIFENGITEDGQIVSSNACAVIYNRNARRSDYDSLKDTPRPGHADLTARLRYGDDFDMSGGGPFSGRMTAPLCIAGGIALQMLESYGITITAHPGMVGGETQEEKMKAAVDRAREEGDSVGGVVICTAEGIPAGVGDPMFDGIENRIARIMFGIPAVKAIGFGAGFDAAHMRGSDHNDGLYYDEEGHIRFKTNHAGGILGGITNGMPVTFSVAFKPTPSIAKDQQTVNTRTHENVTIKIQGRHDPCIVMRAVPVVEAACACALYDALLDRVALESSQEGLTGLRQKLDVIDDQILELFQKRMEICAHVADVKKADGKAVLDPKREQEKLDHLTGKARDDLKEETEDLFSKVMELSRSYQERLMRDD